jgi:hypothetical protein
MGTSVVSAAVLHGSLVAAAWAGEVKMMAFSTGTVPPYAKPINQSIVMQDQQCLKPNICKATTFITVLHAPT